QLARLSLLGNRTRSVGRGDLPERYRCWHRSWRLPHDGTKAGTNSGNAGYHLLPAAMTGPKIRPRFAKACILTPLSKGAHELATSVAGAAIIPAVTGITLGLVGQRGFNRQIGRNQAFNHAGNMVRAAASGYLGWRYGYVAVFLLAGLFGAISIACVLLIPDNAIDHRVARGTKEDDPESRPSGFTVLLKHKPLP